MGSWLSRKVAWGTKGGIIRGSTVLWIINEGSRRGRKVSITRQLHCCIMPKIVQPKIAKCHRNVKIILFTS